MEPELVKMKEIDFGALDDETLCLKCIEPTVAKVRAKDMPTRLRVYARLTVGQQALLAFWIVYNHGRGGWRGLCAELPHLVVHAEFWSELKAAARHLGLINMLTATEEFERVYRGAEADQSPTAGLDESLTNLLPRDLRSVSAFIRSNAADFVKFEP